MGESDVDDGWAVCAGNVLFPVFEFVWELCQSVEFLIARRVSLIS